MKLHDKCTSCPTVLRYDALQFLCRSCVMSVCPACAGMGHGDCDDPMPTTICPECVRSELELAERNRQFDEAQAKADANRCDAEDRYRDEKLEIEIATAERAYEGDR